MLILLLACQTPDSDPAVSNADTGTFECPDTLTWQTAVAPLLTSQCTSCHGSQRTGSSRFGAPESVNLDSREDALQHGERALVRLRAGDMPPSSNVAPHRIARFENWLACGGPGEAVSWPDTWSTSPISLSSSLHGQVTINPEDPELLDASRTLERAESPLLVERWLIDGGDLWLVERERRDDAGDLIFLDQWDPPLAVLSDGLPAGPTSTWRLHTEDGVSTEEAEQWLSEEADFALFDPQRSHDDGVEAVLLTSDTGVVSGMLLTPYGASQYWYEEYGLDPLGDVLSMKRATAGQGTVISDEILYPDQRWIDLVFAMELP